MSDFHQIFTQHLPLISLSFPKVSRILIKTNQSYASLKFKEIVANFVSDFFTSQTCNFHPLVLFQFWYDICSLWNFIFQMMLELFKSDCPKISSIERPQSKNKIPLFSVCCKYFVSFQTYWGRFFKLRRKSGLLWQ